MTARDDILGAVRGRVAGQPGRVGAAGIEARIAARARGVQPARAALDGAALVELFEAQAAGVEATTERVATRDAVPEAVAAYLKAENLPARLVMAPDPALEAAPWDRAALLEIRTGLPTAADEVGVTSALAGVAETGTLVAVSGPTHPSTLNFVPETHIVILPVARLRCTYEDAWDEVRGLDDGAMPRTINLITGPSRSADIAQTVQLGAHGPRRLHIILVDDGEA